MVTTKADIQKLLDIMRSLRDPVSGCDWDQEQTFETIAPYTIEEAYEVRDAIERKHMGDLREELGDLLLQVVYHAQMADERGDFDFGDVVEGICDKMIRRHPHVFGTKEERERGHYKGMWDQIKDQERAQKEGKSEGSGNRSAPLEQQSLLASVPTALPALSRSRKLQKKAASVGFDWDNADQVFAKVKEELGELQKEAEEENHAQAKVEEEFGDVLFALVNWARHYGIDSEEALHGTNLKFIRRFGYIEERLHQKRISIEEATLEEMEALWQEAKTNVGDSD